MRLTDNAQATDAASLDRHFGDSHGLLPLWIAEPYIEAAPGVATALEARAGAGWFGYETRPAAAIEAFWNWMTARHGWAGSDLETLVSPSVGTSIGVLIDQMTEVGDGIILQPPVFTDFKPLVTSAARRVIRNALALEDGYYSFDLDDLAAKAADPKTRAMILCNPHNPVGRVWSRQDLTAVAQICASHDVFVIADEIHADLILPHHTFTPFATVAGDADVSWAALHGPIKTFGLAGVCDTLIITDAHDTAELVEARSSQLHLVRNNVFGLVAFEAAYKTGSDWVDDLLDLVEVNVSILRERLPRQVELIEPEGTYLAWLDFRKLNMDVPSLATWLAGEARLGLSPGHWFGREGAGFARMTIAAPTDQITDAVTRLSRAVG